MIPNKFPLEELAGGVYEPEPKLDGTDVNPLYVLAYEPFPQINVAVLIPSPPPPIGPKFEFTRVNPVKSTVPDADITTFEPTSVIVTVIGADDEGVGVGVSVVEGVLVAGKGVGVSVGTFVASGVGVGVSVGIFVDATVGVGVGVNWL